MTKKSMARQMRDEEQKAQEQKAKNNNCWSDVEGIYQSTKQLLGQHTMIRSLGQSKHLLPLLTNPAETATNIRILAKDLQSLNERIEANHQKHDGRTGNALTPDEMATTIEIFQEYQDIVEIHNGAVLPTAYKIVEDFQAAEAKFAEIAKNQATEVVVEDAAPVDLVQRDTSTATVVEQSQ